MRHHHVGLPDAGSLDLFAPATPGPPGFLYQAEAITPAEEAALLAELTGLPLEPFNFQGHLANRRVVSFGYRYDYADRRLHGAPPIPDFLRQLRQKAASLADRQEDDFVHVLVNQYLPGAGIGWHKDKAHFGDVVGFSLGSACPLRFRLSQGEKWLRHTVRVEPRSAYLLRGPARHEWEHSIAPVSTLRCSVTFRTLAG